MKINTIVYYTLGLGNNQNEIMNGENQRMKKLNRMLNKFQYFTNLSCGKKTQKNRSFSSLFEILFFFIYLLSYTAQSRNKYSRRDFFSKYMFSDKI
ncbi:unnamed protein product [Paramecium octaurelia]|uniref:Uncharacterized protein n=1 Tax=Paramecium octaurelia TaxID=43137 RepID=A0A8S1VMW3_PAROT|nr:unnamed protein product [Paramecium octaurelia]